jgi:diphthamide synthase (EF-2-diphthine--ammonia ligase)
MKLNKHFQCSLVGEGGEYESLVLDCPIFKKYIKILDAKIEYENFRGVYLIKSAKLVDKEKSNSYIKN